jgi:hypothetical protein
MSDTVPPLRCPRCGGEIEVETSRSSGYYSELEVDGVECTGTTSPDYRPGCGARWTIFGDPR